MLPRIVELLGCKDFTVLTRWSTNEIRGIDLIKLTSNYPKDIRDKILSKEILITLSFNKESKTIFFPNLLPYKDENGNSALGELDFCPDVLFRNSFILSQTLQS
jgi:hypothetical protein